VRLTQIQAAEARRVLSLRAGRRLVVSVSGGKDSTATALACIEAGFDPLLVHMDTGWEHPTTEAYVRDYLPTVLGRQIAIVSDAPSWPEDDEREIVSRRFEGMIGKRNSAYIRWIVTKAMFSSKAKRWCTEYIKVRPYHAYIATMGHNVVSAIGIRADESKARSVLPEWDAEHDEPRDAVYPVWRPLIAWGLQDVVTIHARHGVRVNALYETGSRVGCWPCIYARKAEIKTWAETSPEWVEMLRQLEAWTSEQARARMDAKGAKRSPGTTGWSMQPDGTPKFRAFFENHDYRADERRLTHEAVAAGVDDVAGWVSARLRAQAPVDEAIAWASRPGRERSDARSSCTAWGFCEQEQVEMFAAKAAG